MRLRDNDALPEDVARELAAIDAALAGEPVEPAFHELAELSLTLRDERPLPDAGSPSSGSTRARRRGFARADGTANAGRWGSLPRRSSASRPTAFAPGPAAAAASGRRRSVRGARRGRGRPLGRRRRRGIAVGDAASTTALESAQPPAAASGSAGRSVAPGAVGPDSAASGAGGEAARSEATDEVAPATKSAPQAATAVPPARRGLAQPAPTAPQTLDSARRCVERGAQLRARDERRGASTRSRAGVAERHRRRRRDRPQLRDRQPPRPAAARRSSSRSPRRGSRSRSRGCRSSPRVRSRNESSIDVTEQVTYRARPRRGAARPSAARCCAGSQPRRPRRDRAAARAPALDRRAPARAPRASAPRCASARPTALSTSRS